jgi:hypothetical protein
MKKIVYKFLILNLMCACNLFGISENLEHLYRNAYSKPADINEHVQTLEKYASQVSSITEIGLRGMVSTWGLLHGLARSSAPQKSYLGIDIVSPLKSTLNLGKSIAELEGISFSFWEKDDMQVKLPQTDLLFIDSLHTYAHLTFELNTFSSSVNHYILLHDTSEPWGTSDEAKTDYSKYPSYVDVSKRGLWSAVEDFLVDHPEWSVRERHTYNHGMTVLERKKK